LVEIGCSGDASQAYILWPPHLFFSSNLFILFFFGSIVLALVTNGDKIFSACCGGAASVDARSDRVASGRVFVGDFGGCHWGLRQFWFGASLIRVWSPNLDDILIICGAEDGSACGAVDTGLLPQASLVVEAFLGGGLPPVRFCLPWQLLCSRWLRI
jgi:hypothetical protein